MQLVIDFNEVIQKARLLHYRRKQTAPDLQHISVYTAGVVDLIHELTDQQVSKARIRVLIGSIPEREEFVEPEQVTIPPLGGEVHESETVTEFGTRIFQETMRRPGVKAAQAWVRANWDNARAGR